MGPVEKMLFEQKCVGNEGVGRRDIQETIILGGGNGQWDRPQGGTGPGVLGER